VSDAPRLETQAEFAARLGVNPATVTRLKQAGRLVLGEGGRVVVEASLARMQATESPNPAHVANRERLAAQRQQARGASHADPVAVAPPPLPWPGADTVESIGHQTRAAALLKLAAQAELAQMERDQRRGLLIERAAVRSDLTTAAAVILSAAETLPDRLAPLLVNESDQQRIHAVIADEVETFLRTVTERLAVIAAGTEGAA
jgi:hypothetical protein